MNWSVFGLFLAGVVGVGALAVGLGWTVYKLEDRYSAGVVLAWVAAVMVLGAALVVGLTVPIEGGN